MHDHELSGAYDAMGRQYASQLADAGRSLTAAAPEPLDVPAERRAFARECAELAEAHVPDLLAELDGIAAETGVDPEAVRAVPLALDARTGCSLVAIADDRVQDGPLFARNHDFYPSFREQATRYRTDPASGLASVGCSSAFVGRADGVNEAGLAIGFAGVPPHEYEPGVMWQLAVRHVLDTCHGVDEAVSVLADLPHARNANFLVADRSGAIVLVEASPEAVRSTRHDDGVSVATREFHSDEMRTYQAGDRTPDDCSRVQTIRSWLEDAETALGVDDLQHVVGDPETGVCWRLEDGDPRSTIWSWTADLGTDEIYLARDSPAEVAYESVAFPG